MVVWYGLQCVVNFMKMCGKLHDCTGVVTGLPPRAGVRRHCGCAVTFCVLFAGLLITFLLPTAKSKCRSSIWQRKRAWRCHRRWSSHRSSRSCLCRGHRRSHSAGRAVHRAHAVREGAVGAGEANDRVFVVVGFDSAVVRATAASLCHHMTVQLSLRRSRF